MPIIYYKDSHNIEKNAIDPAALYIINVLNKKGYVTYLVGGGVRDLIRGNAPKDFDIGTAARPFDVRRIFKNSIIVGRRFPIVHVRIGKKIIEVATFRKGGNDSSALIKRDISWGTPEDDALRRDFTVNALFYDPSNEVILDFVGGFKDASTGILRAIGEAEKRFKQDPVRMLRLFKFESRGFVIEKNAKNAIEICKGHISNSAGARILDQLFMASYSKCSLLFFSRLAESGILQSIFPGCSLTEEQKSQFANLFKSLQKFHKHEEASKKIFLSIAFIIMYGNDNILRMNNNRFSCALLHDFVNNILDRSVISMSKKAVKNIFDNIYAYKMFANNKNISKVFLNKLKNGDIERMRAIMRIGSDVFPSMKKALLHLQFLQRKPNLFSE